MNTQRTHHLIKSTLLSLGLFTAAAFAQDDTETIKIDAPTPPTPNFTGYVSETYNQPSEEGVLAFTVIFGFSGGELVDVQNLDETLFMPYPDKLEEALAKEAANEETADKVADKASESASKKVDDKAVAKPSEKSLDASREAAKQKVEKTADQKAKESSTELADKVKAASKSDSGD